MKEVKGLNEILTRLSKLFTVKSIVTLALTAVFAVLSLRGSVSQDFMTIFTVIIAFYFGTQHEKGNNKGE